MAAVNEISDKIQKLFFERIFLFLILSIISKEKLVHLKLIKNIIMILKIIN